MRPWAMAAWAGWRPASWTPWPRWACPPTATASATSSACSRRASTKGRQIEHPDPWLEDGTPWEFARPETVAYPVRFGGWVERNESPDSPPVWRHAGMVNAKAYDHVVPGHGTERVSTLRLWKAVAPAHIDLHAFNAGDYARAAEFKNAFENISWVLYPNDSTPAGRELRLKQEYFFTSASIQDILARHLAEHGQLTNLSGPGGHPPERHPPGHRRGRVDAAAGGRTRLHLGRRLGADARGCSATPTTP